jgi:hypothetical protein
MYLSILTSESRLVSSIGNFNFNKPTIENNEKKIGLNGSFHLENSVLNLSA